MLPCDIRLVWNGLSYQLQILILICFGYAVEAGAVSGICSGGCEISRAKRARFFSHPPEQFSHPPEGISGGCEKKIAHAKLAQGGAKLANGGGADKHSSIDIILL